MVGKDPIWSGQPRRWQHLIYSWPCVVVLRAALSISDPNMIQCTEHQVRAGARQSWSDWMVPGRLAAVRHHEAPGRWEERLLLWSWQVREEEWVVTAQMGRFMSRSFGRGLTWLL